MAQTATCFRRRERTFPAEQPWAKRQELQGAHYWDKGCQVQRRPAWRGKRSQDNPGPQLNLGRGIGEHRSSGATVVVQLLTYPIPPHLRNSSLRAVLSLGKMELHSWAAVVGTQGKSLPRPHPAPRLQGSEPMPEAGCSWGRLHVVSGHCAELVVVFSNIQASGSFHMSHLGTTPISQRRDPRPRSVNSTRGTKDPRV